MFTIEIYKNIGVGKMTEKVKGENIHLLFILLLKEA